MAMRLSTGLRNFMLSNGPLKRAMEGGVIKIYSGAQPTSPDDTVPGASTLLATLSLASGAVTSETVPEGKVTLDSGASGSVDSITVNAEEILGVAVAFDTSLTVTATAVAAQINKYLSKGTAEYVASAVGAVITITAVPNSGNIAAAVVSSATTIGTTDVAVGTETTGVDSVNGLTYGTAASGALAKASGVWSGVAVASGTAGWWRHYGPEADAGGADATKNRIDGTCGTSGADMNMSSTAITSGATQTLDSFSLTLPLAA